MIGIWSDRTLASAKKRKKKLWSNGSDDDDDGCCRFGVPFSRLARVTTAAAAAAAQCSYTSILHAKGGVKTKLKKGMADVKKKKKKPSKVCGIHRAPDVDRSSTSIRVLFSLSPFFIQMRAFFGLCAIYIVTRHELPLRPIEKEAIWMPKTPFFEDTRKFSPHRMNPRFE